MPRITAIAPTSPTTAPNSASSAIRRWKSLATCTSVDPIMCITSIVWRCVLSAVRAASTTAAAVAPIIIATIPPASSPSERISPTSGASQLA